MKMAFSTTRKCFGRYVYITTDIRSCLSATPTFVCFSIMEVRIGLEMCTTRPDDTEQTQKATAFRRWYPIIHEIHVLSLESLT